MHTFCHSSITTLKVGECSPFLYRKTEVQGIPLPRRREFETKLELLEFTLGPEQVDEKVNCQRQGAEGEEGGPWSQTAYIRIPLLGLHGCVILGMPLYLSVLVSSLVKWEFQ